MTSVNAINMNYSGIKNDQLKVSLDEVKKAVQKVKGFPKDTPKDISGNTGDASKKVATFAKQLLSKIEDLGGKQGDLAKTLKKAVQDLESGNSEMVRSAQNYLGDPENPANSQDLDAACDILLQILDDVWSELEPNIQRQTFTSTVHSTPTDIETVGNQLKKAAKDVSEYKSKSPKQLAESTTNTSMLCDTFAQMLEARAKDTIHPQLKNELLSAAKQIRNKNDDLVRDVPSYLNDSNNPNKQKAIDTDCNEICNIVDNVLSQVRPNFTPCNFGTTNVGSATPDTIESAIKEMVNALEDVKKQKTVSPKSLVNASQDSSAKVVKAGDIIKAYAKQVQNPTLERLCNDAFNELKEGHNRLEVTTNK